MRFIATIIIVFFSTISLFGQVKPTATYEFAKHDSTLYLDYYKTANSDTNYTVIFVFGGGFITGTRNDSTYLVYYQKLLDNNFNVVAIDYRLGLKNAKNVGVFNRKPVENAIRIAAEDLLLATKFLVDNEKMLQLDRNKFIIAGSSAGAITVLQADYELGNRSKLGQILPEGFRYAGVISFAGAIYSTNGKVKYRHQAPAPTLFFHGMNDRLVTYKQLKLGRTGFFGSSKIVKRFAKFKHPYYFVRYDNLGHEAAALMNSEFEKQMWFIQKFIINKTPLIREDYIDDPSIERFNFGNWTPDDLY